MAIVKKYKSGVEEVVNPLPGIYTITFSSNKKFRYKPGQFLHIALDEYDGMGQWPESRCFSMQSNPGEEEIVISYAVKGRYTNRMAKELIPGKEVWLKLPYGDIFDRGHPKNNCVFIAGGTGITPFLSLFTDNSFPEYISPRLYLGVRTKEHNIFNEELERAKKINDGFSINIVIQDKEGILNIEKIHNDNPFSVFFISGPLVMIKYFKNYLLGHNVPSDKILTDDWE